MFNFVVDRVVNGRIYPALADVEKILENRGWHELVNHWPYTVPCELINHCATHGFPYAIHAVDAYPPGSWYPIGIGRFDFEVDYFGLLPGTVFDHVQQSRLRVLFYYHEGDNPYYIKERLDALCAIWNLPKDSYRFVSGNSGAWNIENFVYFADHELLYWRQNQAAQIPLENRGPRTRDFTVLSRVHKWWRASVVADLHRNKLLDNSYWSYGLEHQTGESEADNPIEVDALNLRHTVHEFLAGGPYTCDDLTSQEHNNHALVVPEHYTDSWCNIVLETLYDVGGDYNTFLTEKTFKAIKHGQPFIIIGTPNSLMVLKRLGYRTFD